MLLLEPKDYVTTKWKNGQGSTAQIAIFPPEADFAKDPFLWRLSSATVEQSGDFSTFPGYDRLLAAVAGGTMTLHFLDNDLKYRLAANEDEVLKFSGDREVSCQLQDGKPVTDLGLIFDPKKVRAEFRTLQLGPKPRSLAWENNVGFIYTISGLVHATVYPGEKKVAIHPGSTLCVMADQLTLLETENPKTRVALIELGW